MIISLKRLELIYSSLNLPESVSLNRVVENNLRNFIDVEKFSEPSEVTHSESKISEKLLNNLSKLDTESLEKLTTITKNKEQFKTTIDNIPIEKPSAYSSTTLGLIGESIVEQKLKEFGFNVINSAERAHTGDLNIIFDEFIIMVEIKNKLHITKDDVDKFNYDIKYLEECENKKVYGLFVSLKTNEVAGIELPIFKISKSYISADEILNKSVVKTYVSIIEIAHNLRKKNDPDGIERILKINEELIKEESEKIELQNKILKKCISSKLNLTTQNTLLKSMLGEIIPEVNEEHNAIRRLNKYISCDKWNLKEARQIIGTYATFSKKSDVIYYLNENSDIWN